MTARPGKLRGFAIVSAIFILVVLAALGAFIVNISSSQQIGSALDVVGVRAYQAARAGIEWGMYRVQATAAYQFGYTSTNPNTRACPAASTSFVPAAATLAGFMVTVTCSAPADPNSGPTLYTIHSTACNQPAAGSCPNTTNPNSAYIERRMSLTF
jgi:MSHA biogenesis protein MshP